MADSNIACLWLVNILKFLKHFFLIINSSLITFQLEIESLHIKHSLKHGHKNRSKSRLRLLQRPAISNPDLTALSMEGWLKISSYSLRVRSPPFNIFSFIGFCALTNKLYCLFRIKTDILISRLKEHSKLQKLI